MSPYQQRPRARGDGLGARRAPDGVRRVVVQVHLLPPRRHRGLPQQRGHRRDILIVARVQ